MRTFDICTELLEDNHDDDVIPQRSRPSSRITSRRRGNGLLSSSGSNRNFRREYSGNLNNNCKLMVYGRQMFQDLEVTLTLN